MVPAGGFTQQQTGNLPRRSTFCFRTSRLTEVEHYDPADLTVGIGAGCTVAQLSADGRRLTGLLFRRRSALPERATIGGIAGHRNDRPAAPRLWRIARLLHRHPFRDRRRPQGKGGGRVVKNVAGYDMMKLLIGS